MPPPSEPPDDPLEPPELPLDPPGGGGEPPLDPPGGDGGLPLGGDGIPLPGIGTGTDTPPVEVEDSLHAPVTTAANAIRTSVLIQLGSPVDCCLLGIVLTLCYAQTVKDLSTSGALEFHRNQRHAQTCQRMLVVSDDNTLLAPDQHLCVAAAITSKCFGATIVDN